MARYDWPRGRKSTDAPGLRQIHNSRLRGDVSFAALQAETPADGGATPIVHAAPVRGGGPHDDLLWLPIGPSTVINGQNAFNARVAGRVRDIQVAPDGSRVYAATAGGGVWCLFTGGAEQWIPLNTWVPALGVDQLGKTADALAVGSLLVQWNTPSPGTDTVFVGTGELAPTRRGTPGNKFGGVGVLFAQDPAGAVLANPLANPWQREGKNMVGFGIFRLTQNPTDSTELVAATSRGLYRRQGAPTINSDWERITATPFDFDPDTARDVTDAVWTPAHTAPSRPARLWVALKDEASVFSSDTGVYVSETGAQGPFTKVSLPGRDAASRLTIGAAQHDPDVVYVLGKGPKLWRIDDKTAVKVDHVPPALFGSGDSDQSDYDQAVAVHPDDDNIVTIGGAAVEKSDAALFRSSVSGSAGAGWDFGFTNEAHPESDATWIGRGVHPDVHVIRYARTAAGFDMWVGCDGGVFRSVRAGTASSFAGVNTGLASLQCGYVVSHPTNDVLVLAGTQDNGTLLRTGDTLWRHVYSGDGGGLALSPVPPPTPAAGASPDGLDFVRQFFQAGWDLSGPGTGPVQRAAPPGESDKHKQQREESEALEFRASSFYSSPGVVTKAGTARLAIGTNRLWLSDNWGASWSTIPSGVDPRGGADPDNDTDADHGAILVVRWRDANRVVVLFNSAVVEYTDPGPGGGRWSERVLTNHSTSCGDFSDGDIVDSMSFLPERATFTDMAVHDPVAGSLYVTTTGDPDAPNMDTLWWFDGTATWRRTHLRRDDTAAPAYAVAIDPDDSHVVYVGTAIGVHRGTNIGTVAAPVWTWSRLFNGLPEAPVQDLSIFAAGTPRLRLLRAAIESRGVWEVDLDHPAVPTTYLRVHRYDSRRQLPTPLAEPVVNCGYHDPDRLIGGGFEWFKSPDLTFRPAPRPATVAFSGPPPVTDSSSVWAFSTALHRVDPAVRATDQVDDQLRAAIDRFRAANALAGAAGTIDQPLWNAVVTPAATFTDPWSFPAPVGEATEADLDELVFPHRARPPLGDSLDAGPTRIDVLVHHRHPVPVAGADVSVTVLMLAVAVADSTNAGAWAALPIPALLKQGIVDVLHGSATAVPGPWVVADTTHPVLHPTGTLEARTPRSVTFEVDLSTQLGTRMLFLAAVRSSADDVQVANLTGATLQDLVLGCHSVAVRSLFVI